MFDKHNVLIVIHITYNTGTTTNNSDNFIQQ